MKENLKILSINSTFSQFFYPHFFYFRKNAVSVIRTSTLPKDVSSHIHKLDETRAHYNGSSYSYLLLLKQQILLLIELEYLPQRLQCKAWI